MINARIYIKIFMAILFLGMMPSCTYDTLSVGDNNANVSLTLSLGEQAINVGSRASDDNFNENKINTVDLFFYKQTGGTAEAPIYSEESNYEVLDYSSQNNPIVSFTMLAAEFDALVENGKKCKVYAIVNRPSTIELNEEGSYSIAELQELELHAPDFAVRVGSDESGYTAKQQSSFVMDGFAEVTRSGNALTGSIPVERVATKISLFIDIEEVTAGETTWEADKVTVSLRRGSMRTNLGATRSIDVTKDIFNLENIAYSKSSNGNWTTSIPFYTYPTNWSNNEGARTHMILTIVWKDKTNSSNTTTRYYGINVNPGETSILRNHHYRISQEIAELGSEVEEGVIPLTPTCDVLDWYDDVDASGSLSRFKYLVVDETNIVMDNVTTKRIYFNSSDPIYLKHVKVDWDDMSGTIATFVNQADNNYESPTTVNGDQTTNITSKTDITKRRLIVRNGVNYQVSITIHNATDPNAQSYITVTHLLDNSNDDKDDDYSRYNINLTVAHVNDDSYNQTIDIMQYPMLSIVADVNSDYKNDNNNNNDNAHKGYVYVNNNNTDAGSNDWHGVSGFTITKNPNRYVVTVSTLDSNDYMIGDPREKVKYTPQGNDSDKIITDDNGKSLTNYYRTDESNTNATMIAPQFMFASSYGVCTDTSLSKEEARSRCATYQEDGYPAGRWRIPTKAEILYVTQLSARKVIPALFSEYSDWTRVQYWSAQGIVRVNEDGTVSQPTTTNQTTGLVRCVYDTWRWGTAHTSGSEKFIYGDEAQR